jgi:predicted CXXCH cytochrome family protein
MISRKMVVCVATALLILIVPTLAFGYANEGNGSRVLCVSCHGATATPAATSTADTRTVTGPHRGYTTTSSKCAVCHQVHNAAGDKLLPTTTISDTCDICHDGTGGYGVYGVILARTGVAPVAEHSVDQTRLVPGGNAATGGSLVETFSATNPTRNMTCSDCHTPHGASVVASFTGDRRRGGDISYPRPVSTRLLKKRPGGIGYDINYYGGSWCGSCHAGRLAVTPLHNHPVTTDTTGYYYENVVRMASDGSGNTTQTGSIGGSNRGFLMIQPTVTWFGNRNLGPICQQCHEDARNVGVLADDGLTADPADFVVTSLDGTPALNQNPRFQMFPHESATARFLVETDDDLCTNCHSTGALP